MTDNLALSADPAVTAGSWVIDPGHSEVSFSVRHLMSKVRGRFEEFAGTIVTGDAITASTVSATIEVPSITTNNAQRDGHLRSSDFFNAESGQQISFTSTGVREDGDGYAIDGELTINGVTTSVSLAAEFLGVEVDAFGVTRLGAEATVSISRSDYGVDFNVPLDGGKLLIGDKVDITLAVEATQA